jgi:hypothetical protein
VHGLLSSQLGADPPTHAPEAQVSLVVQAFPSSQDAVLFVCTHPDAGSHESSVQGFASSQSSAAPPTQVPPPQVSFVVQALPSSHAAVLLKCTQPVAGLQVSSVQPLPSSQLGAGPPWQLPPPQVSPVVQALPSSQAAVLSVWTQPVAGLHESSVQPFPSLQFNAAPPWQLPPPQVSFVVQALPSSQAAVLSTWTQPVARLHESSVQPFPSLQLTAVPPEQEPLAQTSPVVHEFPSSHEAVLLA